jgi:hypothetical protein
MKLCPGDIYEDSAFHPCLCLGLEGGDPWGVSLIDGSYPRACAVEVARKLTFAEAWEWKMLGPDKVAERWKAEHPEID